MKTRSRWTVVGAVLLWAALPAAGAAATGGGGGGGGSLCPGFASGQSVAMRDNCFAGTAQFVAGGDLVVLNEGQLPHTLTAVDGSFDTGSVRPGGRATLTLRTAGVFRVYCTLHGTASGDGMAGLVVVGEPSSPGTALASARSAGGTDGIRISSFTLGALVAGAAAAVLLTRRSRRDARTAVPA